MSFQSIWNLFKLFVPSLNTFVLSDRLIRRCTEIDCSQRFLSICSPHFHYSFFHYNVTIMEPPRTRQSFNFLINKLESQCRSRHSFNYFHPVFKSLESRPKCRHIKSFPAVWKCSCLMKSIPLSLSYFFRRDPDNDPLRSQTKINWKRVSFDLRPAWTLFYYLLVIKNLHQSVLTSNFYRCLVPWKCKPFSIKRTIGPSFNYFQSIINFLQRYLPFKWIQRGKVWITREDRRR